MNPLFERVTIVGAGLIGGSLGLALRGRGLADAVVGVGHRQVSIDRALAMGAIDAGTLDATEGVQDAELVVLATSVGLIVTLGEQIASCVGPGCVVSDVGSTKGEIVRRLTAALPEGTSFVGAHPIAGSEQRGIDAARADLFEGATCVLTPTDDTDASDLERLRAMWTGVGATVRTLTPETHDAILARSSHLPHVAAAMLVATLQSPDDDFVGSGIRDTTRIASSDVNLWCDILLSNRQAVLDAVTDFTRHLTTLRDAVASNDRERLAAILAASKRRREALWPDASHHE